jgi:hypothetical protein
VKYSQSYHQIPKAIAPRPRTLTTKLGYVEPCSVVYFYNLEKSAVAAALAQQEDPSFRLALRQFSGKFKGKWKVGNFRNFSQSCLLIVMMIAQRPRTLSSKLGYVNVCSVVIFNSTAKYLAAATLAQQEDPSFRLAFRPFSGKFMGKWKVANFLKILEILPGDSHDDSSAPTHYLIKAGVCGALLCRKLLKYGKNRSCSCPGAA